MENRRLQKAKAKGLTLKQHKSCFTQKKHVTVVLYKRSAKYSKNDDVVQLTLQILYSQNFWKKY